MGYRGEDASRAQADRESQPPWENSGYAGHGQPEYGQHDDYGQAGGYADPAGYGQPEDYGYQQAGDPPAGYGQGDGYGQPGYGRPQPEPDYGQRYGGRGGSQGPGGGYGQSAGYQDRGYQADGRSGGGHAGQDAGNDWYGGQPAAASGASFADTGTFTLSGRVADEYGTGPNQAQRDPVRGYPPSTGPLAAGYPAQAQPQVRPFSAPTPPSASGPMAAPRTGPQPGRPLTGPQSLPHTGQQERYDGFDPRPGRGGGGYNDFDARGGYDGPGGYGEPGYDAYDDRAGQHVAPAGDQRGGYDDYAPSADPYRDQDSRAGRPGRRKKGGRGDGQPAAKTKTKTGSTGQPRLVQPRGKRPLLLAAVAVIAVVIVGIAAYIFLFKPTSSASNAAATGPLPASGASPSTQACVKQFGTYCHIALRADDPAGLTVSELFPPAFTNDADKSSFSLVSTKVDKTCSGAVIGQDLISALKAGKCTQVVRASYVSGNGKMMGTIGVVNLATTNEAHYAGKVVGQNDFIAPLAAAKGVAKKLGQGTGMVEAEYKGHYLILTWSEFANGSSPSTKAQDSELEQFSSDLVAGTANISLSQRMVTGAPAASGVTS